MSDVRSEARFQVGRYLWQYVVMDKHAVRAEDFIVARYDSRTAAYIDADHRNLVVASDSPTLPEER